MDTVETSFGNYMTSDVDPYLAAVTSFETDLTTFSAAINSDFGDSEVNSEYGTFVGANCHLIQEKLEIIRNTACVGLVPYLQNAYTGFLLAAWGGLLFMLFGVCIGVRQYKNEKYMKISKQINPHDEPSDIKFVDH